MYQYVFIVCKMIGAACQVGKAMKWELTSMNCITINYRVLLAVSDMIFMHLKRNVIELRNSVLVLVCRNHYDILHFHIPAKAEWEIDGQKCYEI